MGVARAHLQSPRSPLLPPSIRAPPYLVLEGELAVVDERVHGLGLVGDGEVEEFTELLRVLEVEDLGGGVRLLLEVAQQHPHDAQQERLRLRPLLGAAQLWTFGISAAS